MTSNVEGLFTRHEFDADRVWTRQGDFAHMHCTARHLPSCGELVWRSEPIIERLLARMDPITQEVDPEAVPTCPACAGSVFFNVREDSTFVERPYLEQAERCVRWIDAAMREPLLILEIRAGFNTPGRGALSVGTPRGAACQRAFCTHQPGVSVGSCRADDRHWNRRRRRGRHWRDLESVERTIADERGVTPDGRVLAERIPRNKGLDI